MVFFNNKKRNLFIILIILFTAFIIRFYDLKNNPPGFFADEAAIGYNAYKILTTGRDEHNEKYPLFFKSFGEYRLPLPIYANIPVIALFGLNETSVRFTAVIFGMISILFTILATLEITGKRSAILAGLLMTIMPWHIHFSRWGAESIYFPGVFSIALYFYLKSFKKNIFFILSAVFFGVSMYTYYPALLISPFFMFLGTIILLIYKRKNYRYLITGILLFSIICLPLIFSFKAGNLQTRWNNIINKSLNPNERIKKSLTSYINHFSPAFLFVKGNTDYGDEFISRHYVKNFGELHIFYLPLVLIGLFFCISNFRDPKLLSLLYLLLLYPLGSALTNAGPFATRSVIGLIPFTVISAIGFDKILTHVYLLKHKYYRFLLMIFMVGVISISVYYYSIAFFIDYPTYSADYWGWQFGPRDIMTYFLKVRGNYDEMYMSRNFNAAEIFIKFYDPNNSCQNCFVGGDEKISNEKKQLFALRPEELAEIQNKTHNLNFNSIYIIKYPNKSAAFLIGKFY